MVFRTETYQHARIAGLWHFVKFKHWIFRKYPMFLTTLMLLTTRIAEQWDEKFDLSCSDVGVQIMRAGFPVMAAIISAPSSKPLCVTFSHVQ
ncbi:MAG: hypothetical protein MI975_04840 [Cytophagales bacterium]|nr:hypothetical protein [Cytophagales bacterium]